jgi:hypothetical protein
VEAGWSKDKGRAGNDGEDRDRDRDEDEGKDIEVASIYLGKMNK